MKPFVLLFGEVSQSVDPLRHVVGEFDSVPEAQAAAERLELHHRGNWAYVLHIGRAQSIVRTGRHQGASEDFGWKWEEEGLSDAGQSERSEPNSGRRARMTG